MIKMWFHKTGSFAVGDNGEPSISTACAVHSEYLKLIICVNNMQDTRRQVRQQLFMSSQCNALNNLRANAIVVLAAQSGSLALQF